MIQTDTALADLYEADETAWLDAMTELLRRGAHADLDYTHLEDYLADMARRDRREVKSRLVTLIAHILKWVHQPEQRSRSWQGTIVEQRQELAELVETGVLRNHAEAILSEAYGASVERAMADTELSSDRFPVDCPYSLEQLLSFDPSRDLN